MDREKKTSTGAGVKEGQSFMPAAFPEEAKSQQVLDQRLRTGAEVMRILDKHFYNEDGSKDSEKEAEYKIAEKFYNAMREMCFNGAISGTWGEIDSIFQATYIDKKVRYETCRGLIFKIIKDFGTARKSEHDLSFTWTDKGWLFKLYNVLEDFKEFFKDEMPEDEYRYLLRRYIGELMVPMYVSKLNRRNEPLWVAEDIDERVDKMRGINREFNLVPKNQMEEYEEQTQKTLTHMLSKHVGTWFYKQRGGEIFNQEESERAAKIGFLARKHDIELPSEADAWKKEVLKNTEQFGEILKEIKKIIGESYLDMDYKRDDRNKIITFLRKAKEAEERIGARIFPEEIQDVEKWIEEKQAQVKTYVNKGIELIFSRGIDEIRELIPGSMQGENLGRLQRVADLYSQKIEKANKPGSKAKLLEVLTQHLEIIEKDIRAILQEMAVELSKTKENAERLKVLGGLRNEIVHHKRKLEA